MLTQLIFLITKTSPPNPPSLDPFPTTHCLERLDIKMEAKSFPNNVTWLN